MFQKLSKQMMQNNPLFKRAEEMAQGKSEQELEQVARNLCKQRGIDIEQAYKQFQAPIPAYQTCSPYESAQMFSHYGTACNNGCGC